MEHIKDDNDKLIMKFYYFVCVVSVFNICWMARVQCAPIEGKSEATRHYQKWMKLLAWPFVFQCAYRSFMPEIYNERLAFWDTIFCNMFIGRGLATIGEVTWIMQVCYGVLIANEQIHF